MFLVDPKKLAATFFVCFLAMINSQSTLAAIGEQLASFPFVSGDLLAHPNLPFVFSTNSTKNTVEVINSSSLSITRTIPLSGHPGDMALNADGSLLYVANFGNKSIDVIDVASLTLTRSIPLTNAPHNVVAGPDNRLYTVTENASGGNRRIEQFDATTGIPTGGSFSVNNGELNISPDRKTLYFNDYFITPSSLYRFDISTPIIQVLQHILPGEAGLRGVLSHDGTFIALPSAYPYNVPLYRTDDFALIRSLPGQAYLDAVAIRPDDAISYVAYSNRVLKIVNTATLEVYGSFSLPDGPFTMTTDATGRKLFVAIPSSTLKKTIVYNVGSVMPGDFNGDFKLTGADISMMLSALTDIPAFQASLSLTNADMLAIGDLDHNGIFTNADIQPMLNLLATSAVPEPNQLTTLALGLGMLIMHAGMRRIAKHFDAEQLARRVSEVGPV